MGISRVDYHCRGTNALIHPKVPRYGAIEDANKAEPRLANNNMKIMSESVPWLRQMID
jgi:hypothetical protein